MKNYLTNYNEDDVGTKFRDVIAQDGKNRDVNTLYKLKSELFFQQHAKFDTPTSFLDDLAARG